MVVENDIRADVAPWDQARIAVEATGGVFPTLDEAVTHLYRSATRQRRSRIRAIADVVLAYEGLLREPHTLNAHRLLRLAAATRAGLEDVIQHALKESRAKSAASQWQVIEPILKEAEGEAAGRAEEDPRPGYPRRIRRVRATLSIRRELAPEGWTLRFTGPDATGPLMSDIMDEVERMFGR